MEKATAERQRRFDVVRDEIRRIHDELSEVVADEIDRDRENAVMLRASGELDKIKEKWAQRTFRLAVFALVKSGKSSLVNALLGDQYLPSANTPETAAVVRIRHSPQQSDGVLLQADTVIAEGAEEIQDFLRELNCAQRERTATAALDEYVVNAPLACLANRSFGDLSFEVLDTPGYNEADGGALRNRVMRLLVDADAIIYVLDYTKLKTEEEQALFEQLSAMRPELLTRVSERLFFVVNKIDLQNRSGLTPEETQNYVANILTSQIDGLTAAPDRILLVSAEQALLARLLQRGRATEGAVRDAAKHLFGISGKSKTFDDCAPYSDDLLATSKLDELEETVFSHIYSKSGELFLQSLLDDTKQQVAVLQNHLNTVQAGLATTVEKLAEDIAGIERDLGEATKGFEDVDGRATATVEHIEEWVKEQFTVFRTEVEGELRRACEAAMPDEAGPPRLEQQRHRGPFATLFRAFGRLKPEPEPGAQTSPEDDRQRVELLLAEVNNDITAYLQTEFTAFWGRLEQEAWERQSALFDELTAALEPLARLVEQAVSKRLDVTLTPVRLDVPRSSMDEMHDQLEAQITQMVNMRAVNEKYDVEERYLISQGGWCSDDKWGTRTVTKSKSVTRYSLDQDKVLAYWLAVIDARTTVSVATGRALVKRQIGAAVARARREIDQYRDGYLRTMRKTLEDSQAGEKERQAHLAAAHDSATALAGIGRSIEKCADFLSEQP